MIRINLAKISGAKKDARAPKGGGLLLVLLLLLLAMGGGYYYITYIDIDIDVELPPTVTHHVPIPQSDAPVAQPSTAVRTHMAENVVMEIDGDERRAENRLTVPYEQMTTAEKINYEVLFARNAFEVVTKNTPPGIRFRALETDNFQTIYLSGDGLSRPMVQEMFSAYRNERGELLPRPLSHIKDDGPTNFMFVITFKPSFGLDVSDPFQALDRLTFRDGLPQYVKNLERLARENNYRLSATPTQISVERAGEYRRVMYSAAGMTTYGDFHKFILALYNERVPAALKKINMRPVRDEQVKVDMEVLFTVRE